MGEIRGGFWGRGDYEHGRVGRAGVLLVNLGTPAAATPRAVRRYLAEFLNDPRVIELPAPLRRLLVHGVVLRVRPRASARAYAEIWTAQGSPLLVYSERLAARVREELAQRLAAPVSVALAMRYGAPRLEDAVRSLADAGVERLVVLPLYPQYSGATTGSAFDAVGAALARLRWVPQLRFVNGYHDHPGYVAALVSALAAHRSARHPPAERVLFSFHGMPRATFRAGDPYHCQCLATARLVAGALGLGSHEWSAAFQSRFGRAAWLEPSTEATLLRWAHEGIARVAVVCPGFSVDCLETLEEVALRYRKSFLDAGGKSLEYVPALNDGADHARLLTELACAQMAGWPETTGTEDLQRRAAESAARARSLGAVR